MYGSHPFSGSLRSLPIFIIAVLFIVASSYAKPILNVRETVRCDPAGIKDVILFFLLNFGAHVGSIKTFPGTNLPTTFKWWIAAFLCPYSGIVRGCTAIARGFGWRHTELQRAARAGALAYVARDDWIPRVGEKVRNVGFWTRKAGPVTRGNYHIHHWNQNGTDRIFPGQHLIQGQVSNNLRELGYSLRRVQDWHDVKPFDSREEFRLGDEASWTSALIAIIQLAYSCSELYQARGRQIERYGYAAYGLCVIPYAVMSLVNFVATAVNADFKKIYLIETDVMKEAISRGAVIKGAIGRIENAVDDHGCVEKDDVGDLCYLRDMIVTDVTITRYQGLPSEDVLSFKPIHLDAIAQKREDDAHLFGDVGHDGTYTRHLPDHGGWELRDHVEVEIEISSDGYLARRRGTRPASRHPNEMVRFFQDLQARHWIALLVGVVAMVVPFVLVGWLTGGFRPGSGSTTAERAWVASWLAAGTLLGLALGLALYYTPDTRWALEARALPMFLLVCVPAIGGCVIVVREILEFGTCEMIK